MKFSSNGNGQHIDAFPSVDIEKIQYVHDVLAAVIGDELPMPREEVLDIDEMTLFGMTAALRVLCWVLGHDDDHFLEDMKTLEQTLDEIGITFDRNLDT